jgi:hypothetical protein
MMSAPTVIDAIGTILNADLMVTRVRGVLYFHIYNNQ